MTAAAHWAETAWALVAGLWWLWAFIGLLVVASLATTGAIALLDLVDQALERWHLRRGQVRAVDDHGREQWVPRHPASSRAADLRARPEVRRG